MDLRDGRYERLRWAIKAKLLEAEALYAEVVAIAGGPDDLAVAAMEDDADEWALLLFELDAAVPQHLREEIAEL